MPDLSIRCVICGIELSCSWVQRPEGTIDVEPCDPCLQTAHDEGVEEGRELEAAEIEDDS